MVERQTLDRKDAGSNPGRSGRKLSSPGSTFCAGSYFGIRSTAVLPQLYVKDTVILPKVPVAGYSYLCSLEWEVRPCTGAWLYGVHRTCYETAAVSDAASTVYIQKGAREGNSQSLRVVCDNSTVSLLEST